MTQTLLSIDRKDLILSAACVKPHYNSKTIIVEDSWEYIELWIRKIKDKSIGKNATYYWSQAKEFYKASEKLDKYSSPLLSYYFMLNVTKCLLTIKRIPFEDLHGITGQVNNRSARVTLKSEMMNIKTKGVLSSLYLHFNEAIPASPYNLYYVLYNLPFLHRAFTTTFNVPELLIPINEPYFVRFVNSTKSDRTIRESWIKFEIVDKKYQDGRILKNIPTSFERDIPDSKYYFRKKKRFEWSTSKRAKNNNLKNLLSYHSKIHKYFTLICGDSYFWYLRRDHRDTIFVNQILLIFSAMHRLSELSRYDPLRLEKHFFAGHNWLLTEFINLAPKQFLNLISSEITGKDFKRPGIRLT